MAGLLAAALPGLADLPQWYLDAGLPAADADGDGIPDAWERRTYSNPAASDSALDRDGDGLADLEEFVFGSDPRTFSTMGDGWSDAEKRGAGLDAVLRVVPTVTPAQWLAWLGWDAQEWQALTATNVDGFACAYAGFVYNTPPYSDEAGAADFWLETRTDRPAWLTVGDALTTNCFPVRAGVGRARVRAAYGGPVSLTLDPLPGTLEELPGAADGLWLCEMSVLPACPDTVLFEDGETPPPVPGDPDSVNGLLLLAPPPPGSVHALTSPPPTIVLQPLRMTDGTVFLGNGGWYCLCASDSCDWPDYDMVGCDAVSMAMNGVTGSDPILSKEDARDILQARQPAIECTVTQTVMNASFPFLYGRVVFSFRFCEAVGGVRGAQAAMPGHSPSYLEHDVCQGIGCTCSGPPLWTVGFSHIAVSTRNLSRIETGNDDVDTTEHCLGVVWQAGAKLNLFSLLHWSYGSYQNDLYFTTTTLSVDGGELVFGCRPKDLEPQICLIKLHYKPNPEFDQVFDKLWVVVNAPETETSFTSWYEQSADISWTTNLPSPFSRLPLTNASQNVIAIDPEPDSPGLWESPHGISSYLHHDAKYEMRSERIGDHGHQATYDETGTLILNPIAAGTADFQTPYNAIGLPNGTKHRDQDVYPFIRALQLEGNPVHKISSAVGLGIVDVPTNLNRPCIYKGDKTDKYIERRPVLPTGKQ